MTEDVLVQVGLQVLGRGPAMRAVQPRLEVRDRAMGAWEDRLVAGGGGALVAAPVVPPLGGEAVISMPGVGVHDRAGLGRGAQQAPKRLGRGVREDLQPHAPAASAANLDHDPAQRLLAACTPAPAALLEAAQEELVDLDLALERLALPRDHRRPELV